MPPPLTRSNIFFKEPYSSILAILSEYFDRGLSLHEIQYAIMDKDHLYHIDVKTHELLDETIERLIKSTRLKKYNIKKSSKKKKKKIRFSKGYTIQSNTYSKKTIWSKNQCNLF